MVKKCCITSCKGNYDKENNRKVFCLPSAVNPEERERESNG